MARAAIVIGIPYASIKEKKLVLRQEYYIPKDKSFEWSTNNAMRAVNQSIGRIIRHINDFGTIFLVDNRYHNTDYKRFDNLYNTKTVK